MSAVHEPDARESKACCATAARGALRRPQRVCGPRYAVQRPRAHTPMVVQGVGPGRFPLGSSPHAAEAPVEDDATSVTARHIGRP